MSCDYARKNVKWLESLICVFIFVFILMWTSTPLKLGIFHFWSQSIFGTIQTFPISCCITLQQLAWLISRDLLDSSSVTCQNKMSHTLGHCRSLNHCIHLHWLMVHSLSLCAKQGLHYPVIWYQEKKYVEFKLVCTVEMSQCLNNKEELPDVLNMWTRYIRQCNVSKCIAAA